MSYIATIDNLVKKYDNGNVTALNGFSYQVPRGKIIGLLGPNGAGKTTLIKILVGLIKNFQGKVSILGNPIGVESKKLVAYLPDHNFIDPEWTVKFAVEYYKDFFEDFNQSKAIYLLNAFDIDLNRQFKTLSKGNKEKTQLILTLARNAQLYIFDEPIAGVDPASRETIFELILKNCSKDSTIIISTHLAMDVENILDEFVFVNKGKVVRQGVVKEIRENTGKTIDELFKEDFRCSVNF